MASHRSRRVPLSCDVHVLHDAPLDIIDIYLSYCFSPPIKASRPKFEKPIHNWNPHFPRCVVSRKWKPQQPKCWNNLKHHPLSTLLPPCFSLLGCFHYIIGLTNVEAGPKWTRSYEFGTYCLDHTNALCTFHQFLFSNVANTLCTLRRHAAQTIPLENFGSRIGEGHSMQIRRNYPKSFWTLIIQMET